MGGFWTWKFKKRQAFVICWAIVILGLIAIEHFRGLSLTPDNLPSWIPGMLRSLIFPWIATGVVSLLLVLGVAGLIEKIWPWFRPLFYKPEFLTIPKKHKEPFHSYNMGDKLVGRDDELKALNRFLNADGQFKWWMVTGRSGVGKTKLVYYWMRRLKRWDCGFFGNGAAGGVECKDLRGRTLIVIDDAGKNVEEVAKFLEQVRAAVSLGKLGGKARVLLLECATSEELSRALLAADMREFQYAYHSPGNASDDKGGLARASAGESGPLAIKLLSREQIGKLAGSNANMVEYLFEISEGLPFIVVEALREGKQFQTARDLFDAGAKRFQEKAKDAGISGECLWFLGLATLTGGWEYQDEIKDPCQRYWKQYQGLMGGKDCRQGLAPVSPDLLGCAFVLRICGDLTAPRQNDLLKQAWGRYPHGVARTLQIMGVQFANDKRYVALDEASQGIAREIGGVAWRAWLDMRVWLIADLGGAAKWADMKRIWGQLKYLAGAAPHDREMQLALAKGAVNVIILYGAHRKCTEMGEAWEALKAVAARPEFAADREIQSALAKGSDNAIYWYGEHGKLPKMEEAWAALRAVAARAELVKDREIQWALAIGTVNAIAPYGKYQKWAEMGEAWEALKAIAARDEFAADREIQLELAKGAVNAINHYGEHEKWTEMDAAWRALRFVAARGEFVKDREIQWVLANGTFNAISGYGEHGKWVEMGEAWGVLKAVAARDEFAADREIQLVLANGAVNAIARYGEHGKLPEMGEAWTVLRAVAARAEFAADREIQLMLALGTVNAMVGYGKDGKLPEMGAALQVLREVAWRFPQDEEFVEAGRRGAVASALFRSRA